jgi:hypothetical protein
LFWIQIFGQLPELSASEKAQFTHKLQDLAHQGIVPSHLDQLNHNPFSPLPRTVMDQATMSDSTPIQESKSLKRSKSSSPEQENRRPQQCTRTAEETDETEESDATTDASEDTQQSEPRSTRRHVIPSSPSDANAHPLQNRKSFSSLQTPMQIPDENSRPRNRMSLPLRLEKIQNPESQDENSGHSLRDDPRAKRRSKSVNADDDDSDNDFVEITYQDLVPPLSARKKYASEHLQKMHDMQVEQVLTWIRAIGLSRHG